jgi:excinuclease ABC subunit C
MKPEELREKIANIPKEPGIYIFKDSKGKPIYIGKASGLKNRLLSYLKTADARISTMVQAAKSVEYQITASDIEALILESQLIKKYKPQFNVVMRDDKQYFFVALTDQKYPRIFLTHQFQTNRIKEPIKEMIGPFTDGTSLKVTLKQLRRLFPFCTCKQLHHFRCLNAHIGKCLAFCCLKNPEQEDREQYMKNIHAIRDLLSGKRESVVKQLTKEMQELSDQQEFEKAMGLRYKIERVKRVFENAKIISSQKEQMLPLEELKKLLKMHKPPLRIEGYDISNISGEHATGSMVVFDYGKPDKDSYRKFKIRTVKGSDDTGMLREVLSRRMNHPEWPYPDLIIIDGGKGQLSAARSILENHQEIAVISLTKNEKHIGDHLTFMRNGKFASAPLSKLPTSARNVILSVDSEAHRFAISYYRTLHQKTVRG